LPFTNVSGDPKQDYFSDGLSDYLITDLSRLPDLFVIARNSSFTYKGKAVTAQQIGRELGVRGVLEGSVFKAPSQVRITVQLADATTGANLWAARFDKPLKDIFSVQDEIVREIVTTLNLLTKAQMLKIPPGRIQPTNNLEAFDYWLRGGEEEWLQPSKEGFLRSRKMFQKAIALDPNYADAYALLALNHLQCVMFRYEKDSKIILQRVAELAQRAISLDDSNAAAYVALGEYYGLRRQFDRAIALDQRAIALDRNNPSLYFWLGDVLDWAGRADETVSVMQKAMRLDPRNAALYAIEIGQGYNGMQNYAAAVPFLKQGAARYPDNLGVHAELAISYANLGQDTEARAQAAEIMRLNPQFSLKQGEMLPCMFKDEAFCRHIVASLRKAGLK
jgi:adenylate cyclase